ncbi:hypothetical protein AC1031_016791 [Aphanomyces cochlioides]|nr:hypothetical protein AC1031_016791 [Aphanomyces cochlioides]
MCSGWAIPRELHERYEEIYVPFHAGSRRSGFNWLTNKAYNMSLEARPSTSKEEEVEDAIKVKLHLGEDDTETSIPAIECHVQFTIDANLKMWPRHGSLT